MERFINFKLVLSLIFITGCMTTPHPGVNNGFTSKNPKDFRKAMTAGNLQKDFSKKVYFKYALVACHASSNPDKNIISLVKSAFSILKTKEYHTFNGLKNESVSLTDEAIGFFGMADELRGEAEKKSADAQQLLDSYWSISDQEMRDEMKSFAGRLDEESARLFAKSDSLRELGRNSIAASDSKRIEAELYIQSTSDQLYNQVLALGNQPASGKTIAMNSLSGR